MAGLGLGPADFELLEIDDPDERAAALEATLSPKLQVIGQEILAGLARVAGRELFLFQARPAPRRGHPVEEALVAFSDTARTWRGVPYFGVAVTRAHLHARIGVRGESPRREAMRAALRREAANLAKKGKPFRKLRAFDGWDYEELPELAPAHSAAFWQELSEALEPGGRGLDVGIAFSAEEARSLAIGDLLGTFRDLAPLFKVLASGVERAEPRAEPGSGTGPGVGAGAGAPAAGAGARAGTNDGVAGGGSGGGTAGTGTGPSQPTG